ncbi:DUF4843 domain-containing protein [uncultured Bacteroides sp.]|uniref:DUF4843 domain-containing protein n=1 Tax=uncultured Bacteroides sp. TaxID=162156 RepID=UPI0025D55C9E|nr:DUF4843 domain-containing protein [uncultured Bacteroides sp.]
MKRNCLYILLFLLTGSWLASCEKSEPPFYDANSNGAYFDYDKEKLDTIINFADYILEDPKEITVKIKIKLLGYVEDFDRTLVLKAIAMENYPQAQVTCPEVVFKAGEYKKEIEIKVGRPETQDTRYGMTLCVDEERSDIGIGAEGFENFNVYVEDSYQTPAGWEYNAGMFFGEFSAEKHIFIVKVTKDEDYAYNNNPWGVYPDYQLAVIDSIREHNQAHPNEPLNIAIPFISGGPEYPKPYYWTEKHDKYLGTYSSSSFISLCNSIGADTSNEKELFNGEEENLKGLHKKAIVAMMKSFNNYFNWGMSFDNFRNEQIPMLKDMDYDVVTPIWWTACSSMITPYYGDYSEAKYKFMIKTLLNAKGDKFFLPEMFPIYQDWNSDTGFAWDTLLGGEAGIKECYKLFYAEWEKNKDQYDFTFPKRETI